MMEQFLIVRAIDTTDPLVRERIAWLLRGADTAAGDTNTQARNVQLELLVAALLRLGGVQDVQVGEPDLRIPAGAQSIGVAVKRLSNPKQRQKRLYEAIQQIRRQQVPGLVVLGLDRLLDDPVPAMTVRHAIHLCRRDLPQYRAEADVLGVLGIAIAARWPDAGGDPFVRFESETPLELITPPEEQAGVRRAFKRIGRNIVSGIIREMHWLEASPDAAALRNTALGSRKRMTP